MIPRLKVNCVDLPLTKLVMKHMYVSVFITSSVVITTTSWPNYLEASIGYHQLFLLPYTKVCLTLKGIELEGIHAEFSVHVVQY